MSSRKVHLGGAFALWFAAFLVYYFVGGMHTEISLQRNALWIGLTIWLAGVGALMPDWDLIWKHGLPHRNLITHSAIAPVLVCSFLLAMINPNIREESIVFLPLYASFLLGYSSHLLLDLFGTKNWQGTACIRFYWLKGDRHRTMSRFKSKFTLFTNGIILLALSILLMLIYFLW